MKGPIVTLIVASFLLGCTSKKEKKNEGKETFEKMVILEDDPSSLENSDHLYEIR